MSAEGDEAERLQVLEQYRKKVRVWCTAISMHKKGHRFRRLFLSCSYETTPYPYQDYVPLLCTGTTVVLLL